MNTTYLQTNLVSDIEGLAAITDPSLINPWGLTSTSTSPFWVVNDITDNSTLYTVTGTTNITKTNVNPPNGFVAIPPTANGNQGPTGIVANTNTSSFLVGNGGNGASAHFIFADMNGSIYAWDTGAAAFNQYTTAGACYTGLAINQAQTVLYAANNAGTGSIDVFNSAFAPVSLGAGAFATPAAISALGLDPFNVQDINGSVYVTYALPGDAQNYAGLGEGAVAVFTETGVLKQTIVGGVLSSPWGIALAPAGFGQFGGDLLVGNESYLNSEINAFNPVTGAFVGAIPINVGSGNTPGGLWALDFGTGGSNGSPNTLYFTDGINGEVDGLFGAISVVPSAPSDFTGDGRSDGLFQNVSNGQVFEWQLNGTALSGGGVVGNNTNPQWQVAGTGYFTASADSDILFQNTNNGQVFEWEMNSTSIVGSGFVGNNTDPSWQIVGTGDFNGNGTDGIIFQNVNNGQVFEWHVNGTSVVGSGSVGNNTDPTWHVVGTGDFTGNGIDDILFQNSVSGQVYEWQMNGASVVGSGFVGNSTDPTWHVVGTGDFTGNGIDDILFQNSVSGQLYEWQMNGTSVVASGLVGSNNDPTWHVVGTGDFTGNGTAGIFFQNVTTGNVMEWLVNGFSVTSMSAVGNNTNPTWHATA
jgi:uncharacterized protein (TIGR03118 family)